MMIEVPTVRQWIMQFMAADRPLAVSAFDALEFSSLDRLAKDLRGAIREAVDRIDGDCGDLIIEPIVGMSDILRVKEKGLSRGESLEGVKWDTKLLDGLTQRLLSSGTGKDQTPDQMDRMYNEVFPHEVRDESSGSEKIMDVLKRDMAGYVANSREPGRRKLKLAASRESMKSMFGRPGLLKMLLITDNISSGKQAIDHLRCIIYAAIHGPLHGKKVDIEIVSWTATNIGIQRVTKWWETTDALVRELATGRDSIKVTISSIRSTDNFDRFLNSHPEARGLFNRYSGEGAEHDGLGYDGVASNLVVLGQMCSNTLPEIFHRSSKSSDYKAIFDNRKVPDDLHEYLETRTWYGSRRLADFVDDVDRVGQAKLLAASRRYSANGSTAWGALILACCGYTRAEITTMLRLTQFECSRVLADLQYLGWVKHEFIPTAEARDVVQSIGLQMNQREHASGSRLHRLALDSEVYPYYPRSVRGVR